MWPTPPTRTLTVSIHGTNLLPRDLTEEELAAAPVLLSADALLIDDLTVDEDDRFAALSS